MPTPVEWRIDWSMTPIRCWTSPGIDRGDAAHELVAAEADDRVVGAEVRAHRRDQHPEHAVARGVAVAVVDALEPVDVDVGDDELAVGAPRPVDLVAQGQPPHLAPEGTGEAVEVRALQLGLEAGALQGLVLLLERVALVGRAAAALAGRLAVDGGPVAAVRDRVALHGAAVPRVGDRVALDGDLLARLERGESLRQRVLARLGRGGALGDRPVQRLRGGDPFGGGLLERLDGGDAARRSTPRAPRRTAVGPRPPRPVPRRPVPSSPRPPLA